MVKMQLRLSREQVATLREALLIAAAQRADAELADQAWQLRSWLGWRASKLWGAAELGELERKRAS